MIKFYRCRHCGNVIVKVVDSGVPVVCCGEVMEELKPNTTDGAVAITVENNGGSTLPETGGIGTTIFYAAGALLVLCAGVLLFVKLRMRKAGDE